MKIVLASSNTGKIKEFREICTPLQIELVSQSDLGVSDADETGLSFIENALLKARHASRLSGLPAIADDSGLAVDILKGAPGIYSARYAGPQAHPHDNIRKLLQEMAHVEPDQRHATFYCVIAFVMHADDPTPLICEGQWRGSILDMPVGTNGFGYDPIFYIPSLDKAAAQLSADEKNTISHRGIALKQFINRLPEKLNDASTLG